MVTNKTSNNIYSNYTLHFVVNFLEFLEELKILVTGKNRVIQIEYRVMKNSGINSLIDDLSYLL